MLEYEEIEPYVFVTKLAGFEHTEYIQPNATHEPKSETDIPMVQGKNIRNGKFVDKYDWYISKEISESLPRSTLKKDCILIPYVGSNLGEVGVFYHTKDCHLASNVAKIELTSDAYNIEYLKYYFQSPIGQSYLFQTKQGSAQPNITMESIRKTKVIKRDLPTQKKIADLLSCIDDKIALNNKTNTELENMAKTIYDYWFTQFDFPDKNGHPYKTSGGQMVYNEILKREIPAGWDNCTFNYYIERITNGLNPRKNFVLGNGNNYYVTIRSLLDNDIDWNNCDKCDDEALQKINSRSQLQIGDVIFSAIGTIGRTYRIYEEPKNWNISETSFTIRPKKDIPHDFFYCLLRSPEFQLQSEHKAMGSTLKCLVMDSFCEIPCIKVDLSIANKFSTIVAPMYKQIYDNNKQNRELTKLRDYLLPLLMNGQIEVK